MGRSSSKWTWPAARCDTAGEPRPVIPGNNLRLTLDLDLQQAMEDILKEQLKVLYKKQAVAIAMNPQTGEILGMVSLPSYDNNEFTGGISVKNFRALQKNPDRPLVNHAISGQFPPGSTFKIIVASGALEEQVDHTRHALLLRRHSVAAQPLLPRRSQPWPSPSTAGSTTTIMGTTVP